MIGLDTDVIVRHLAQDHEAESAIATALLENELTPDQPGFVSVLALSELHRILTNEYGVDRARFVQIARGLLSAQCLRFDNLSAAWNAVNAYQEGCDFVPALLAEVAHTAGCKTTVTFDPNLSRHPKASLLVAAD